MVYATSENCILTVPICPYIAKALSGFDFHGTQMGNYCPYSTVIKSTCSESIEKRFCLLTFSLYPKVVCVFVCVCVCVCVCVVLF